jgi:hypothetical protein
MIGLNKEEEKYLNDFNEKYEIGDKLLFRTTIFSKYKTVTVKRKASIECGSAVAFFEEISGYCSVDPTFIKEED